MGPGTLSRATIFAVTVAAALTAPCPAANNAYYAAGVVSQVNPNPLAPDRTPPGSCGRVAQLAEDRSSTCGRKEHIVEARC